MGMTLKNRQTHLCFRNDMTVSLRRVMKIAMGIATLNPSFGPLSQQ